GLFDRYVHAGGSRPVQALVWASQTLLAPPRRDLPARPRGHTLGLAPPRAPEDRGGQRRGLGASARVRPRPAAVAGAGLDPDPSHPGRRAPDRVASPGPASRPRRARAPGAGGSGGDPRLPGPALSACAAALARVPRSPRHGRL